MIVHADDGLDELSVTSPSSVLEVTGDGAGQFEISDWRVDPAAVGVCGRATMEDLGWGTRVECACDSAGCSREERERTAGHRGVNAAVAPAVGRVASARLAGGSVGSSPPSWSTAAGRSASRCAGPRRVRSSVRCSRRSRPARRAPRGPCAAEGPTPAEPESAQRHDTACRSRSTRSCGHRGRPAGRAGPRRARPHRSDRHRKSVARLWWPSVITVPSPIRLPRAGAARPLRPGRTQ